MFENILTMNEVSYKRKIAYKTLVSAGLIALAVILPQLVHLAVGQSGGVQWLPMYLPVLVGGCLLGAKWALSVGVLSPLVSFLLTSSMGTSMPTAERLPFMIGELAVFAIVSGLFTKKISENGWWAFVAVLTAQICGRTSFLGLVAVFRFFVSFTPAMIWTQIQIGFAGLAVQAVLVPAVIMILRKWMLEEK